MRHNRVPHLGAKTPEDNLEVARGDRGRAARLACGLDVVLVVRAGEGPVVQQRVPHYIGMCWRWISAFDLDFAHR